MAPLPTTSISSITVHQLIAPTTSTPAGSNFVGITFDPTGNIYMAINSDLYISKLSLTLVHLGSFSSPGACGDLTSCSYPISVLPVMWVNFFVALLENKMAYISWQVSQQVNDKGCYVVRSTNGTNWNQIAFIASEGSSKETV
jgi:hypothetical protein